MRALAYTAVALLGCATVPAGPPPPPPEESFRGVKAVALVHRLEAEGFGGAPRGRRRDPLDVLQEALRDRGLKTVTVELPEWAKAELAPVDALTRLVEERARGQSPGAGPQAAASVGGQAAPVLDQLECDALAIYVRGDAWRTPGPPPSLLFGDPFAPLVPAPPPSSIALVARDGAVVLFTWGGSTDPYGAAGPFNAAEAVDAALALLAPPVP